MTEPVPCTTDGDHLAELRQKCVDSALHLRRLGWDFVRFASQIVEHNWFTAWGFRTASDWFAADLPAYASNWSRYVRVGHFVRSLPDAEQAQWEAHPVWLAIEGVKLLDTAPQALLEAIEQGASCSQIRQAVARGLPDQHLETDYKTIKLTVSAPVYALWQQAQNRARYESCKAQPTPDDIIQCLCMALLNEPLFQPDNGVPPGEWIAAVHGGEVRCYECKSYDRTQLDWHHVVARSAGGAEGTQVPLCRSCHSRIQPTWREWLAEHPELQEQA